MGDAAQHASVTGRVGGATMEQAASRERHDGLGGRSRDPVRCRHGRESRHRLRLPEFPGILHPLVHMSITSATQPTRSITARYYVETEWVYTCRLGFSSHLRFVVDLETDEVICAGYRPFDTVDWLWFDWDYEHELEGWELAELLKNLERFRRGSLSDAERSGVYPAQFTDQIPDWAEGALD